jgi:hypothetical protein
MRDWDWACECSYKHQAATRNNGWKHGENGYPVLSLSGVIFPLPYESSFLRCAPRFWPCDRPDGSHPKPMDSNHFLTSPGDLID